MTSPTQIVVQKVANGYLVSTPFQPQINSQEEMIRKQARIMKDEFQSDSLLKGLQNSNNQNEDLAEFKIEAMPNVFIFKTIEELIAFFKTYL